MGPLRGDVAFNGLASAPREALTLSQSQLTQTESQYALLVFGTTRQRCFGVMFDVPHDLGVESQRCLALFSTLLRQTGFRTAVPEEGQLLKVGLRLRRCSEQRALLA